MSAGSEPSVERPLSGAAKTGLFLGAGAVILLFYAFSLLSIALLGVLLAGEFVVAFAALRVGLAGLVARILRRHMALLAIFVRSFRLRRGAEFRLLLRPEEAPELFAVLRGLCGRSGVALPAQVSLEMGVNAWVRLKGYRRGAGTTILGVGYDLLAGMTREEIEGVLAHEISHAKLIQRGFKALISGGLARAASLARGLAVEVDGLRRAHISTAFAGMFLRGADFLTRLAARLVATCSRQDEFEADRGAAELCGAAPIRSALSKLPSLELAAVRLPWRERVARLQSPGGFSHWLVSELTAAELASQTDRGANVLNPYSTHPSLHDRLAALPSEEGSPRQEAHPGISLLAKPDEVAEKLISEIQRVAAEEEQKDSRRLRRWSRKLRSGTHLRPLQLAGVGLILAGGLGMMLVPAAGLHPATEIPIAVLTALGFVSYRFGRYRDRMALPVPDFALIKTAWQGKLPPAAADAGQIEKELRGRTGVEKRRSRKLSLLAAEAYAALAGCDYPRTLVAARLCLELNKKSVEGALALAVAGAALRQPEQPARAINFAQKLTGLATPSTTWAAAWALALAGDWGRAEAFLEQTRKGRPEEPTLLTLLALCQSQRGKLQTAILSARRACSPKPRNPEHAKVLIDLLVSGGYLGEARERLQNLESESEQDPELMFTMVRLSLLSRDLAAAEEWTAKLLQSGGPAHNWVRLGGAYEAARLAEKAAGFYAQAMAAAHYPEAHLGLGRIETARRNPEQAERHLLSALDLDRKPGEGGTPPAQLMPRIFAQLLLLRQPVADCQAWIGTLAGSGVPAILANVSFLVYAPRQAAAEEYLRGIMCALQPGKPPVLPESIRWRPAPREQQPVGPVRPGVQGVLSV